MSRGGALSYEPKRYWSDLHEREASRLSAVGYAALGEGFNRVAYRRRLAAAERLLLASAVPPNRLLEAAVGVGAYAPLWRKLGVREWVGVDISEHAIASLRERFPDGSFHALDLASPDESAWAPVCRSSGYDVVTAIDVLYHLPDDVAFARALIHLAGQVRPGGVLVLSDVFVQRPVRLSEHVARRPLGTYEDLLRPMGLSFSGREPVFAVLSAPVPRSGVRMDAALALLWRIAQKAIRMTPAAARDLVGAGVAGALSPLDTALCRAGASRGTNLELAAFRRQLAPPRSA